MTALIATFIGSIAEAGQLCHCLCAAKTAAGLLRRVLRVLEDPEDAVKDPAQAQAAVSDAGSLGGKAVGAGAGGCMVFVAGGDPQAVKRAAINAGATVLPLHLEWVGVHKC